MLPFLRNDKPPSKLITTHGPLTGYLDPKQPPTKRQPFTSIWNQHHSHIVDILLPAELLEVVHQQILDELSRRRYAKVTMSLAEVLSGAYFDEYLKTGDVSLLSEGRIGVDEVFSVHEGILRIEVDKATYERCGVVGKPIIDGGRKHQKSRFLIQADLRLSEMAHGKKGFNRIFNAAKDVLNSSKTWLFFDHKAHSATEAETGPIKSHHPKWCPLAPTLIEHKNIQLPRLPLAPSQPSPAGKSPYTNDSEFSESLHEYFSLLSIGAPRLHAGDDIDPYLCRYSLPAPDDEVARAPLRTTDITQLRVHGFIPSKLVFSLFATIQRAMRPPKGASKAANGADVDAAETHGKSRTREDQGGSDTTRWIAMQAHGFRDEHLTIFLPPGSGSEFVEWTHQKRL